MVEEGMPETAIHSFVVSQGLLPSPSAVMVGCGGTHWTGRITQTGQWHTVLTRNLNGECLIQIFVKRAVFVARLLWARQDRPQPMLGWSCHLGYI